MFPFAVVVTALACFGHLLITRASLGFGYTLGIRHRGWHMLLLAHASVGIAIPILMVVFVGSRSFSTIAIGWQIYMSICVAAVFVGAIVLLLRHLHSVPHVLPQTIRPRITRSRI